MISFEEARKAVAQQCQAHCTTRDVVRHDLTEALGYVLAEEIRTDREYPPFDRSTRDGYAVRAADAAQGAALPCAGEIKAGDNVSESLAAGTCVQIMTGAAIPAGADAVVMIEFTRRDGDTITFERTTQRGQNIVPRGSEAAADQVALGIGQRLGFAEVAIAAQVGASKVQCFRKPSVAILSTGDEVVALADKPGPFHIRNSNSVSIAAQVQLAGGAPVPLGNARDRVDELSAKIEQGLQHDVLVLSGGVSMGKYDLVESVLKGLGADFYFDAVAIRPGKPAVFGRCERTFVFGLPGNPVSTMVTFQLFVTAALDILSGTGTQPLPLLQATLGAPVREKGGLTHFLPARLEWSGTAGSVSLLPWQGSGDIAALARANCFLVIPAERPEIATGETVSVLPRFDVL